MGVAFENLGEHYRAIVCYQRALTIKPDDQEALNYMGIKESFKITIDMVQDEKYFDKLFSHWYENQKVKNAVKN